MKKRKSMNRRALALFTIFSLLFFILTYRFLAIQITGQVEGKELRAYAKERYAKDAILEASRGSILDRNGEPLAHDTITYKLVAVLDPSVSPKNTDSPKHVVDPEKTAEILSQYIDMDKSDIYSILTKDAFQVEFGKAGRNLSYEQKNKIESLKLPGITFVRESKRSYPNGVLASHLIGFASMDYSDPNHHRLVGQIGIEASLNDYLEGKNGKIEYESDRWGYILPTSGAEVNEPENGDTVYLTIDRKIQTFLEEAMNEVNQEYEPTEIMGIVADAKTGAILAMSQRPTFDPNTREGIEENWQNLIVETAYEPGSTFKFVPLAAAIEEGIFNPNEKYQSGVFNVEGSQPIKDHNDVGWGEITYAEGFQRSSNVAMANLVKKMGTDTFRNYIDRFKFGMPTGIGLPNEAAGVIQYQWPRDQYATSYGQGTSVTALQMIQAMTAITNKGKMMKPYLIEKIVDDDGNVVKNSGMQELGSPVSSETAKQTLKMLESTVNGEHGTGKPFKIDGYTVAGKTGTAQIYESGKGLLTGWNNYLFSFIGVAPADDPELIVYVLVKQPNLDKEKYESGSVPVSKIFNSVMKNSLQYLNIKPDESIEKPVIHNIPDYTNKNVDKAIKELTNLHVKPVVIGNGKKVTATVPQANTKLIENEKILILTDKEMVMPDMTGWSKSDVMKFMKATGVHLNLEGNGFVVSQSIAPKTIVTKESTGDIKLQPPLKQLEQKNKKRDDDSSE
jgi:penicillin-binding protein 2B